LSATCSPTEKIGRAAVGSYQKRKDELKAATTDGWIVNRRHSDFAINGGAGVQKREQSAG